MVMNINAKEISQRDVSYVDINVEKKSAITSQQSNFNKSFQSGSNVINPKFKNSFEGLPLKSSFEGAAQ